MKEVLGFVGGRKKDGKEFIRYGAGLSEPGSNAIIQGSLKAYSRDGCEAGESREGVLVIMSKEEYLSQQQSHVVDPPCLSGQSADTEMSFREGRGSGYSCDLAKAVGGEKA